MGTEETLGRGAIQFMTAGSGVTHSEHNHGQKNPLRFIQIWLNPRSKNLKPNYGSFTGKPADRQNKWAHLVTDVNSNDSVAPIKINTDANFFVTQTQVVHNTTFELKAGRQAYMICVEGSEVHIQSDSGVNETLTRHDAAEVFGPLTFTVSTAD